MENLIVLRGSLDALPRFSHENHGIPFYRFSLSVPRLSGTVDTLPVVAPGPLPELPPPGGSLRAQGQLRSHNITAGDGRHLQIFLFAGSLVPEEGEPLNRVTLEGTLCREPVLRRTPLGREICDLMVAVPRAFHRADYIPCILWGRLAQAGAGCHTGDPVRLQGRLQSREYVKQTPEGPLGKVAYELSVMNAELPGDLTGLL